METAPITIDKLTIGTGHPLTLIAGPCVIEDPQTTFEIARQLREIVVRHEVQLIFKASYDKANRTAITSFRGPGLTDGLAILADIKSRLELPILSDVHQISEVAPAAAVLDVLQIPAFLCRQTDLLVAAGNSGKPVNVKKGQFVAPWDMVNALGKLRSTGNPNLMVTERGYAFGYNNLVVDFRSIPILQQQGWPVVFDATHSVQLPGGSGDQSAGERQHAPLLARSAVAAGADAVFLEVHPDPDKALCDGPNSLPLDQLDHLLGQLTAIHRVLHPNRN